jgi:RES domain-containing protein
VLTYRITTEKWAGQLAASGRAARWNGNGRFMIYSASTRALACLENLVHRRSIGRDDIFKVSVIGIPASLRIDEIKREDLPADWSAYLNYSYCQQLGDKWLDAGSSGILRVPSSIIPEEYNYLLNPAHPAFASISVKAVEDFAFDHRLVGR